MADSIDSKDLVDGGFYRLRARNFRYGVFVAARRHFVGIRRKFDVARLDVEFATGFDPEVGTATATEFIAGCLVRPLDVHLADEGDGPWPENKALRRCIEEESAKLTAAELEALSLNADGTWKGD